MKLENKKVLITGSEGFIGSHLTEELVKMGADVTALVQYNSFNSWGWIDSFDKNIKDVIKVVTGDIREYDNINKIIKGQDVVFHLAALIAIPYSYHSPMSYIRTNIEGTAMVLESCKNNNIQKIIHTSTSEVYGNPKYVPIDENHSLSGQSPYSASKIGADKIVESYHLSYNLPVVTIRPFNTFGERQSIRAIIPTLITQFLTTKKIKLGNLEISRDFNYIKNTIDGFIKGMETDNIFGEVINIGSGEETYLEELIAILAQLINTDYDIEYETIRTRPSKSEVRRLQSESTKAHNLLNWRAKYSLEEGLVKTIEWYRNNLDKFKTDIYTI